MQNVFLSYSGWVTGDDLHSQAVNAFNNLNLALMCQVALLNSNYMMSQYATFPTYLICGILQARLMPPKIRSKAFITTVLISVVYLVDNYRKYLNLAMGIIHEDVIKN